MGTRTTVMLDADAIRLQLERVLTSSHFRNSKRCQSLLKFVVEQTVEGHRDQLKERTIGVRVFGRTPSYDTAQDAVVRNAAVEVRKRLAQYYLEPLHEGEMRIDLPSGAYAPEFPAALHLSPPEIIPSTVTPASLQKVSPPLPRIAVVIGLVVLGIVGFLAVRFWPYPADADLSRFWAPMLDGTEIVQICVGQPRRIFRFKGSRRAELENKVLNLPESTTSEPAPISPSEVSRAGHEMVYLRDALSMARVTGLLQTKGKPYRLRTDTAPYSELRRSPLIAIGAFNNLWTMRLTQDLRFSFQIETIDGVSYNRIVDRMNPNDRRWSMVRRSVEQGTPDEDYMIVTRVLASATERTVISIAGFYDYGTWAAGEFATDAGYLSQAFRNAPKGWEKKNIQVVLHTKIIEGTPGPPTVVAMHFW